MLLKQWRFYQSMNIKKNDEDREADIRDMTMRRSRIYPFFLVFLSALLITTMILPAKQGTVYAATPKLDYIRVALFIQTRDMAPSVTLSIAAPASIGLRAPEGVRNWLTVDSGMSVRFSVDQYRLLMYESDSLEAARAVSAQLSSALAARERAYVFRSERSGQVFYQVVVGHFTNQQEASAVRDRLLANAAVQPLVNGSAIQVLGPYHLTAGSYITEDEARAVQQLYQAHGIHAEIVYHESADQQLVYSVWIGEAVTPDQLNDVMNQALSAVPDFTLSIVDSSLPYLYRKTDYSDATPITHYLYNANNQKVWYSAAAPGIKVAERYGRTYRGSMELTTYNGRLALINELPFEQYLYAVVSNEMGGSFPLEALKAQAVAARTFALQQGMRYGIAHISDTTYDQAYYGYGTEAAAAIQAVDATASEVVMSTKDQKLITPYYSSNAGGFTSETAEVWGTPLSYIHSVPSPDEVAEQGRYTWYRVVLPNGKVGYVRQDLVMLSGTNKAGLQLAYVIENNVNVRPTPDTTGTPITQVSKGDPLVVVETVKETNAYSWISQLWRADALATRINQYARSSLNGPLQSLQVGERGISGRVKTVIANGSQQIDVSYPDAYRTVMGGLRSTRFDIEQTNDLTILGAGGKQVNVRNGATELYVLTGSSATSGEQLTGDYLIAVNQAGKARVGSLDAQFRFVGRGYGHGLGMSQYGAKALADIGYDYKRILQYYYKDVQVVKG